MMFSSVKIFPFLRLVDSYPLIGNLLPIIIPERLSEQLDAHRAYTKSVAMKRINNVEQNGRGDFMDSMLKHRGGKGWSH